MRGSSMDKKVFRPLWSYNVQKTEQWLSSMMKEGFQLVKFNRLTRLFSFTREEAKNVTYRITYDRIAGVMIPQSLKNDGWRKTVTNKSWHVFINEESEKERRTAPSQEGLIYRNQKLYYFYYTIFLFFLMIALFNISLTVGQTIEVVESPYWMITYVMFALYLLLWSFSLYSMIRLKKENKQLLKETKLEKEHIFTDEKIEGNSKMEEIQFKRSGKLIVKRKLGWMFAPDKLEIWLEKMEEEGYNLYRVSKLGTAFTFLVGSPRKISYCLDYQNIAKENVFHFHQESGWENIFANNSSLQKWTIWSKEYHEGEEKPRLYSDKETRLMHAKKIAITYTVIFLPLVLMYIYLIQDYVRNAFSIGLSLSLFNTFMFILLILTFGSHCLRSWLYYKRLKNS